VQPGVPPNDSPGELLRSRPAPASRPGVCLLLAGTGGAPNEACGPEAPFIRARDLTPSLEACRPEAPFEASGLRPRALFECPLIPRGRLTKRTGLAITRAPS